MPRKKKQQSTTQSAPAKTNVIFLIDESGSMSATANDVRGGFNSYVERLKTDGNEYSLTAIKFGTVVRPLFANLALSEVPPLTEHNYMPLDSTALYDAIGYAFAEATRWATPTKSHGEDRVLMIIMTDGEENASRVLSKDAIVTAMKAREAAGNWTFVYLGADQDAWNIAGGLGIAKGNVMAYASTATASTFESLARATTTTAGNWTASQTRGFFRGD